jgi:LmbE family N-acetylglucosaminyl deacetylase
MRPIMLFEGAPSTLKVLALGAHSDDIEIGCGATLLALQRRRPVDVTWVVLGAEGVREEEASASASTFLAGAASSTVVCHGFRDGYFPYDGGEVKDVFEDLKRTVDPDLIFTHTRHDLHQDHRLVCELTWNTWRDHLVLEYEIPKYDGDLGTPNFFVEISEELAREKARMLETAFASQRGKHWFDESLFLALMRLRGAETRSRSGYAEAFFGRKVALAVGEPS